MRYLVVTTHPLPNSLCKALSDHIVQRLRGNGHEVALEDLYADRFDPVLTPAERASYYHAPYDASRVGEQVDRLLSAEALILVFPTWWFSFPAMLKGWFDRVWGPGIAYEHASDFGPIKPRLRGLRSVLAVTTLGASWWVDRLIMGQPVKKVLQRALLGACAPQCRLTFLSLYNSEQLDDRAVERFKVAIDRALP